MVKYRIIQLKYDYSVYNRKLFYHSKSNDEGREVKTITFPFRKNELEGTIPYGGVRYARKRNDSINGR